jgi:hypothetical protein
MFAHRPVPAGTAYGQPVVDVVVPFEMLTGALIVTPESEPLARSRMTTVPARSRC